MKRLAARIAFSCLVGAGLILLCPPMGVAEKGFRIDPSKPSGDVKVGPGKYIHWQRIPISIDAEIQASNKLLQEGKPDEAETMIRRLLTAREKELGSDAPQLVILLRGLGSACWAQKKLQDAVTAMKRSVDLQLKDNTGPTEDLAYDLRVLGQSYQELGQLIEAQETLALGLYTLDQADKDETKPVKLRLELLYCLARAMQQDNRWSKAELLLERLYRLQTQHQEALKVTEATKAETLMRLALGKSEQGEHKAAQEYLRNAIDLAVKQRRQDAQQQ